MYNHLTKFIRKMILFAIMVIVAMLFVGCSNAEIFPETSNIFSTAVTKEQERSESQATSDEEIETKSKNATDTILITESEEVNFQWSEVDKTEDVSEISDYTFDYGNGIELPDHNWD